jgi:hypothetical protein
VWDSSTYIARIPLRFKEPLGSQPTLPHAAALSYARRASPQGSMLIKVTALRPAILWRRSMAKGQYRTVSPNYPHSHRSSVKLTN